MLRTVTRQGGRWKWGTLADAATVITGNTPPTSEADNYGSFIPFVKPSQLLDRPVDSGEQGLSQRGVSRGRVAPVGAVLVSCIGVRGKTGLARVSVAFNQQINAVVFAPSVLPAFGFYYAQTLRSWLYAQSSATTLPIVNKSKFLAAPFPLVQIEEQREIVAEIEKQFSRLDEAVANLQRVKANLRRYRASVLLDAFVVRRPNSGDESSDPTNVDLPVGWTWRTYADIGEVTTGFTPSTSEAANFGGAIPFFKPTDLDAGDNVRQAREYLSEQGLARGRRLPAGSVLVTCIGATIGKTGLAQVACATNQQINSVSPIAGVADARFVFWWTVSPRGQQQIHSNASATTLPIINKSKFSALAVPMPPLAAQRRIVEEIDCRLSIVREVEAEVDANLKRALALRQSVLAAAFKPSGRPLPFLA